MKSLEATDMVVGGGEGLHPLAAFASKNSSRCSQGRSKIILRKFPQGAGLGREQQQPQLC